MGRVFATAVRTGRRVLAKQHITCPNATHRLNAVDDLSVLFRLGRLGVALLPGQASLSTMCDICDDVMVDLLKGAEGLQTLLAALGSAAPATCLVGAAVFVACLR